MVANDLKRYSIGDRTPGLKTNEDGSLDLYIQHESPGKDKESNWQPAPNGPRHPLSVPIADVFPTKSATTCWLSAEMIVQRTLSASWRYLSRRNWPAKRCNVSSLKVTAKVDRFRSQRSKHIRGHAETNTPIVVLQIAIGTQQERCRLIENWSISEEID